MIPMKEGYPYACMNFGGYQYCKTAQEGIAVLVEMRKQDPDTQLYSDGFFSNTLKKWAGKGQWFPVKINGENI